MDIPKNFRSGVVRNFDSVVLSHPFLPNNVFLFDAVIKESSDDATLGHEVVVEFNSLRTCQDAVSLIKTSSAINPLKGVNVLCTNAVSPLLYRIFYYCGVLSEHTLVEGSNSMFNPTFVLEVDRTFCVEQGSPVYGYKGENFISWEYYRNIFKSFNASSMD